MLRDDAALLDIIHAARLIQDFTRGMDQTTFLTDLKTQSAVLHQILILGEAVKRLSEEFRATTPQVPWSLIARMRDRAIHHYDMVNLYQIWEVVVGDIPALLAVLAPLLPPDPGAL
jgi:uncharacterized protein with HEPN domain